MRRPPSRTRITIWKWLAASLAAAVWLGMAWHSRSPYLLAVRDTVFWACMVMGIPAAAGMARRGGRVFKRPTPLCLLAVAGLVAAALAGQDRWHHARHRSRVAAAERLPELGNHLIIGWLGLQETRLLAAKGGIAGVFLTKRDFPPGTSVAGIRRTVDDLQAVRRAAGLRPLWIATDQEGGAVAKLTPPLSPQPPLADVLADLAGPGLERDPARAAEIVRRVTLYADAQGRELAAAGINLNFAPVVDLRPPGPPGVLDLNSRIATRAIAADPEMVALAGEAYARALARHGITPVLKHFPGLGRVPADTHHFAARLQTGAAELAVTDWLPFRRISARTDAGIMLSHVRVDSLDRTRPASCSDAVVRHLRKSWGFGGLLVTDDFSMAPISHGPGGTLRAVARSRAAGVDLILLSYDPAVVYDLLGAALER